jgi:hypothetical protein
MKDDRPVVGPETSGIGLDRNWYISCIEMDGMDWVIVVFTTPNCVVITSLGSRT